MALDDEYIKPDLDEPKPIVRWSKPGSPAPFVCDYAVQLAKGDSKLAEKIAMDVIKILNPWKFDEEKKHKGAINQHDQETYHHA